MQLSLIVLALLLALAAAIDVHIDEDEYASAFDNFKARYGRSYSSSYEEDIRYGVFRANYRFIQHFNTLGRHKVAVNKFADLTGQEFAAIYNGYRGVRQNRTVARTFDTSALPTSVDWRTKGVVTGVKDQGQCGSCWAFSATGSMEGQWALQKKQLVSLSEQNLVDCSTDEQNAGCEGGLMDQAFQYVIKNKGVDTEKSYPYSAEDGTCTFSAKNVGATLTSYKDVPTGDESQLQAAVANIGPVSVAIDASQTSFQLYSSGIYNEPECSSTQLDHGVLAVGYGVSNSKAYWIVKNSWGADWGQEGYIWMSRNAHNQCGIATSASYPIV